MLQHETFYRSLLPLIITILLPTTALYAQQLPDSEWTAYFSSENTQPREFRVSILTLFGPQEFMQRVKPKGTVLMEGKQYRKAVVLHDSGPFANQIMESFVRVSEDGLYERREDGSEVLLAPRPLVIGQSWTNGNQTMKYEGLHEFESFNRSIPACLKITVVSKDLDLEDNLKEVLETKYYERGKGLIYKSGTGKSSFTKILHEYAAMK